MRLPFPTQSRSGQSHFFTQWSDAGAKCSQLFDKQFPKIPGAVGDNITSTQLGNLVPYMGSSLALGPDNYLYNARGD